MNDDIGPKIHRMGIHLARNLKKLLHENNLTASALSREAGVPTTTLSNWLAGQSPKNIHQVYQVSQYFGLTIEELIFDAKPQIIRASDPLKDLTSEIHAGIYEVILRKPKKDIRGL